MKHKGLVGLFLSLLSMGALASSEVCVDHRKNTVTISADYYFYGNYARANQVSPCAAEINRMFNRGLMVQLNKSGSWKKLIVKVRPFIVTEQQASNIAVMNHQTKNNFVRIDIPTKGSRVVISEHGLRSNFGYFIVDNDLGTSTTCSHEFAHGLGLKHVGEPCDWRGKGVPPIMANRGCLVDKKFQYNPKAKAGKDGGTVNPIHRQVLASEISKIKMGDLSYSWKTADIECASQGTVANNLFHRDGQRYRPSFSTDKTQIFKDSVDIFEGDTIVD